MNKLLFITISIFVFSCWCIQFLGHQIWRYYPIKFINNPTYGISFILIIITLSFLPIFFIALKNENNNPKISINKSKYSIIKTYDYIIIIIIIALSLFIWYYFSYKSINYPLHVYGDEYFHNKRSSLTADYTSNLWNYFWGNANKVDFYPSYFIFYPSLAYITNTIFSYILGDVYNIANQRLALIPNYVLIAISIFIISKHFIKNQIIVIFLAISSATSPLLLSYTMSFYIEIQYIFLYILSIFCMHCGLEKKCDRFIYASILIASIGPIFRESTASIALCIGLVAVYYYRKKAKLDNKKYYQMFFIVYPVIFTIIPFTLFYIAKSIYSDWDQSRMSNSHIFQQNFIDFLLYSLIYIGPTWLIFSPIAITNKNVNIRLISIALWLGIAGLIIIYSRFTPGYMPWSRNYLMFYAPAIILKILGLIQLYQLINLKTVIVILILGGEILFNVIVSKLYLDSNIIFHESEAIFNDAHISSYIKDNRDKFLGQTIYSQYPVFKNSPAPLIDNIVVFKEVPSLEKQNKFLSFSKIIDNLPDNSKYLLFYYYENRSLPEVFSTLPSAKRPTEIQLREFNILSESIDPLSENHTGILLLERI